MPSPIVSGQHDDIRGCELGPHVIDVAGPVDRRGAQALEIGRGKPARVVRVLVSYETKLGIEALRCDNSRRFDELHHTFVTQQARHHQEAYSAGLRLPSRREVFEVHAGPCDNARLGRRYDVAGHEQRAIILVLEKNDVRVGKGDPCRASRPRNARPNSRPRKLALDP